MLKKNVELCDVCGERVAIGKCVVCGKSLCREHAYLVTVELFLSEMNMRIREGVPKREKDLDGRLICPECLARLKDRMRKMSDEKKSELEKEFAREIFKKLLKISTVEAL